LRVKVSCDQLPSTKKPYILNGYEIHDKRQQKNFENQKIQIIIAGLLTVQKTIKQANVAYRARAIAWGQSNKGSGGLYPGSLLAGQKLGIINKICLA